MPCLSRLIKSFPAIPNIMLSLRWYSVHFVTQEQNITSTTKLPHNHEHNRDHLPVPPTKAMGAITQNRRGRPAGLTSCYSGVVRFRRARRERRRRYLLGCMFWAKFGRRGGGANRDGRTGLNRLSRSKKPTIPQSTVGRGPCYDRRIGRGTEWRPRLWQRKLGGDIFDAQEGWKAWPIGDRAVHFNGSACSHSISAPQSTTAWLGGG